MNYYEVTVVKSPPELYVTVGEYLIFLELIQLGVWVSDFVANTSLRASFRTRIALRLRTSPAVPV